MGCTTRAGARATEVTASGQDRDYLEPVREVTISISRRALEHPSLTLLRRSSGRQVYRTLWLDVASTSWKALS